MRCGNGYFAERRGKHRSSALIGSIEKGTSMLSRLLCCLASGLIVLVPWARADDWPQFRGADGEGPPRKETAKTDKKDAAKDGRTKEGAARDGTAKESAPADPKTQPQPKKDAEPRTAEPKTAEPKTAEPKKKERPKGFGAF